MSEGIGIPVTISLDEDGRPIIRLPDQAPLEHGRILRAWLDAWRGAEAPSEPGEIGLRYRHFTDEQIEEISRELARRPANVIRACPYRPPHLCPAACDRRSENCWLQAAANPHITHHPA